MLPKRQFDNAEIAKVSNLSASSNKHSSERSTTWALILIVQEVHLEVAKVAIQELTTLQTFEAYPEALDSNNWWINSFVRVITAQDLSTLCKNSLNTS